jgi:sugar-specific transcriptional regulator TrmB
LEARVYLALSQMGNATAKTIAKSSKVSHADTYRVLSSLLNDGLVEKEIAVPYRFKATPMDEGLAFLIQRRENQSAVLKAKVVELLQKFEKNGEVAVEEVSKFVLIPAIHFQKIRIAVGNAKTSVLCFSSLDMFRKVRFMTEDVWKKGVTKGVKFQFILGNPQDEKAILKLDGALKNSDCFEIRWARTEIPCVILIDKSEVFLRTEMNLQAPVLWSDNPVIVRMIQEHFESKWKTLKEKYQEP